MRYLNLIHIKQTRDFLSRYGVDNVLAKIPEYIRMNQAYLRWRKTHVPSTEELEAQRRTYAQAPEHEQLTGGPRFSILVPACNTDPLHLRQMIESVLAQTFPDWELCIADGSTGPNESESESGGVSVSEPPLSEAGRIVQSFAESRIRYLSIENRGIALNTNAALSLASGEFIVLLDHDDMLSPDALSELSEAIDEDPQTDALYSDEDMVSAGGTFFHNPNFKPEFDLDLLRSCNYICHLFAVRRELALKAGGFSADCEGSQDYDFILKTTELSRSVRHIPKVLYHWRVHKGSVSGDPSGKAYAYDSAVRALEQHFERCSINVSVQRDAQPGFYRALYPILQQGEGQPLVSVVTRHCPDSLREAFPPFRLEFADSLRACRGEYILFLNEIRSISPDTFGLLLSNCRREDIGIAAPRILTAQRHIAETGLIYNAEGKILSPFAGKKSGYPGYRCYALCQHQVSLVGPYCFMTSAENFRWNRISRQKKDRPVQTDRLTDAIARFCFRTLESGLKITVIPQAEAVLTKEASRRIQGRLSRGPYGMLAKPLPQYLTEHPVDPCYSPNLSQDSPYTI